VSEGEKAPTLDDLVANRTMSKDIAATLRATAKGRHSYLVVAIPRFAGKTTVMKAMLAHAPEGIPIQTVEDDGTEVPRLLAASKGGYIVVPEIAKMMQHGYIWGAPVRKVFEGVGDGVSLATALHAPSMEEAMGQITGDNGVPDKDAQKLELVVIGGSSRPSTRSSRCAAASRKRPCCTAGTSRRTSSRICRSRSASTRAEPSGTMVLATKIRQR